MLGTATLRNSKRKATLPHANYRIFETKVFAGPNVFLGKKSYENFFLFKGCNYFTCYRETKCTPQLKNKIALSDIKTERYWSSVKQPIYRFKTVLLLIRLL